MRAVCPRCGDGAVPWGGDDSLLAGFMLLPRRFFFAAMLTIPALSACEQPVAGTCGCPTSPVACDGCPAVAEELCIEGACIERGDPVADVTADLSIQRGLDGVVGVTLAVIDAREASCADLEPLQQQQNILAGARLDVRGGPFHPDTTFGVVPAGPVLLAAEGLNDDGDVVGFGCVAGSVVAGDNKLDVVTVAP